jgi:hypothetical protein
MDPTDVQFLVKVQQWRSLSGDEGPLSAADRTGGVPLESSQDGNSSSIRCCVRKRPLLPKEAAAKVFDVVSCASQGTAPGSCVLHEPRVKVDLSKALAHHVFAMNGGVFDEVSPTVTHD